MYDSACQSKSIEASRPTTEIEGCLTRTENALSRLHTRVDALADRLRPLMRATGSGQNGQAAGVPQEALSPMGNAIRTIEGSVDAASDRLESLLSNMAL